MDPIARNIWLSGRSIFWGYVQLFLTILIIGVVVTTGMKWLGEWLL